MPDWADTEAEVHLRYLGKCCDRGEKIEYLAAALRKAEAAGAYRGVADIAERMNVKLDAPAHG